MHVECREVSAAEQKGWNLHHSPDAGHHRIKYCYWVSLQRSALERLYQPHPPPSHPPVLLQMLVPTSSPLIWVCWLIWWSTCCSSMRSCCSRSAEGNCFPWAATSDMDSLSLGDWKIRRFQKKIFTPLAQEKIDKRHSRKRQRKNTAILPVIETSLRRYILMRRIWRASPATVSFIRTVVYQRTEENHIALLQNHPFSHSANTELDREEERPALYLWEVEYFFWLNEHRNTLCDQSQMPNTQLFLYD